MPSTALIAPVQTPSSLSLTADTHEEHREHRLHEEHRFVAPSMSHRAHRHGINLERRGGASSDAASASSDAAIQCTSGSSASSDAVIAPNG